MNKEPLKILKMLKHTVHDLKSVRAVGDKFILALDCPGEFT